MDSTAWIALGGVAQFLAACATVYLAVSTRKLAGETETVASQTGDEARATTKLAEQARADRELACWPQLEMISNGENRTADRGGYNVFRFRNLGTGPALGCRILALDSAERGWAMLMGGSLAAKDGQADGRGGLRSPDDCPWEVFRTSREGRERADVVMMCSDILGRRFRFLVFRDSGVGDPWVSLPAEVWTPSEDGGPGWATNPDLWIE